MKHTSVIFILFLSDNICGNPTQGSKQDDLSETMENIFAATGNPELAAAIGMVKSFKTDTSETISEVYDAKTSYSQFDSSGEDRKSTRLNSSHRCISYAVFCLKKKKKQKRESIKIN